MMRIFPILLLLLPSCVNAGTEVSFDPVTHTFSFKRSWLGGPFYIEASASLPDGTEIRVHCESEVSLEDASRTRISDDRFIEILERVLATSTRVP